MRYSSAHALVLAAAIGALSGCVSLQRRSDGLQSAHLERLYFGRSIRDTGLVSDSAWARFVREVLTPEFPEGSTIWESTGHWRAPDGTVTHEKSFVVELLHLVTPDVEARVQRVMETYKSRFAQQSVLRMVTDVRATF